MYYYPQGDWCKTVVPPGSARVTYLVDRTNGRSVIKRRLTCYCYTQDLGRRSASGLTCCEPFVSVVLPTNEKICSRFLIDKFDFSHPKPLLEKKWNWELKDKSQAACSKDELRSRIFMELTAGVFL